MAAEREPLDAPTASTEVDEHMGIGRYLSTRLSSLVPPMRPAPNPIKALALLNTTQWLSFAVCRVM